MLTVQFSKASFSGVETTGVVSVTLLLERGTSASIINVTIIPFDQSPVSAKGKIMPYTN